MQAPAMPLRAGQLVRMHSLLGAVATVNGKTGVLKQTSKSLWVVELEEPCVIGSDTKRELRIHPKNLTVLSQAPMLFSEKLRDALIAVREEMQASGVLRMERHIVPNPLAQAVKAGHTNVYDQTVQFAFNAYLAECGVVVPTAAGSSDQQAQDIADQIEEKIWTAFNARVERLGLWDKYRDTPDDVAIKAFTAEYRSTCIAHHADYHAQKQQQNDDALHKFNSEVRPCHNEGCVARGQKNAFNAATGQFRSATCSECKVCAFFGCSPDAGGCEFGCCPDVCCCCCCCCICIVHCCCGF